MQILQNFWLFNNCLYKNLLFISSFFYLQFIQQAIRKDVTNIEAILTPPEGQDEGVWKYEHLR